MAGLGKHIKGLHALKPIAAVAQQAHIAGQRGRIAGNIYDGFRLECTYLLNAAGAAAAARRIQKHAVAFERQARQADVC